MPALANAMGELGEDKVPELEAIGDFQGEMDRWRPREDYRGLWPSQAGTWCNIQGHTDVAEDHSYQSAVHFAKKGSMARPMTHLRLTCSLICLKNTYHTQPDMKAYFRALSSHSSAMMVYLKKCFAKIFTNIYFPPCSDTNREETCSESSEDKERPVMVADMERNKPGGGWIGWKTPMVLVMVNLQRRKVKLVMWKIGFLPHLSTSWPKVSELMMVPTYVAEITQGPRTF